MRNTGTRKIIFSLLFAMLSFLAFPENPILHDNTIFGCPFGCTEESLITTLGKDGFVNREDKCGGSTVGLSYKIPVWILADGTILTGGVTFVFQNGKLDSARIYFPDNSAYNEVLAEFESDYGDPMYINNKLGGWNTTDHVSICVHPEGVLYHQKTPFVLDISDNN